jgi:hypothetical protein
MLYVLIMYCVGNCPAWLPAPNDVLFYSKLADCQAEMAKLSNNSTDPWYGGITDDGERIGPMQYRQTCATVYAEPEQIDRIIIPTQLERLIADYQADRKAHPVCALGDDTKCLEHDPPQPSDPCKSDSGAFCNVTLKFPKTIVNLTSSGSCSVGEYAVWRGNKLACKNPDTKKIQPACAGPFKGRCAADAHPKGNKP